MDAPHLALGCHGESLALAVLGRAGYAIVATGYRTAAGEIDIIARDGPCLVFVEVKTRRTMECGSPAEAVTCRKQRRIIAIARDFLARHPTDATECRFDVIAILLSGEGAPVIDHIRDAFDAS